MPTVIILYIIEILFLVNLCNALSYSHEISDAECHRSTGSPLALSGDSKRGHDGSRGGRDSS